MEVMLGLCQMRVAMTKTENLRRAEKMIAQCAGQGAKIVALPEMFNCPYGNRYFGQFAEETGGETNRFLAEMAARHQVYLIGGSIPERREGRLYNTCYCFDDQGRGIGRYSKMHLFDINVPGQVAFQESKTLTAGDELLVIETPWAKIGVAICFDIRFPELFRLLALAGAELVVLPGAFNMTTGPAHWELSIRMRAVDNQLYFAAVSPARDTEFTYVAYGNSAIADPWGRMVGRLDEREGLLCQAIDLTEVQRVRRELPLLSSRREDVYQLSLKV